MRVQEVINNNSKIKDKTEKIHKDINENPISSSEMIKILRSIQKDNEDDEDYSYLDEDEYMSLDEIEDSCHLLRQFRVGRHQDAIGVHPGIPLMEIAGAHTSDVFPGSHLDMGDLGVHFQSLHTKDHMHTRILQLL